MQGGVFLWKLILWLFNAEWEAERLWWDFKHWRLNLALWIGVVVAIVILAVTANSVTGRVEAGIVFTASLLWGLIWDWSSARNSLHWRLNLLLWIGCIVAVLILATTGRSLPGSVEAGIVFAAFLLWAIIWNWSRPTP